MNLAFIRKFITDTFSLNNIHFFVILACVLLQMFNWGEPYRFFAYLNLAIILVYFHSMSDTQDKTRNLLYVLAIPLIFIALHLLAVMNIEYTKDIRRIVMAVSLALGVWMLAIRSPNYVKAHILKFTLVLLFVYGTVQAISLWLLNKPYGTTTNPHYLAFYSSAGIMATIYCLTQVNGRLKSLLILLICLLGSLLLHTSSRPTWIALIFTSVLVIFFLEAKLRKLVALIVASVIAVLTLSNVDDFYGRFKELLVNLSTEERVVIWRDAWHMQTDSNVKQWILGHGLNSFESAFKAYSNYHLHNIDFNSPHNFILEILYTSGAIGLLLAITLIFFIYRYIFSILKTKAELKNIYLLLLALVTANLITVSITVPFFSGYNLNMLALVVGIMLFHIETSRKLAL